MAEFMKVESLKNGVFLGILAGALLLWGSYIKDPLINFINGLIPISYQFEGLTAIIIILGTGALLGYIIDRT